MKVEKILNITRGVLGSTAAITALVTFILLGVSMDTANFPGSNLKIEEYSDTDDRAGQYKKLVDGYQVEISNSCSNFVQKTDETPCNAPGEEIKEWNSGWLVTPDCKRTLDLNECAPFGTSNALSIFGQMTFVILAIQVVLFGAHTCVAVVAQEKELVAKSGTSGKSTVQIMKDSSRTTKATLALTIIWLIVGFALFVASVGAWAAFCDKIDTGLGRKVGGENYEDMDSKHACASVNCTMSFGSLFATFIFATVWYRIPHILVWFGVLEAV